MLPNYVLLDLETTGATPLRDRITEIALIRYENRIEVARWQTLVNPGTIIAVYIQQLTGITNEMVDQAPTFRQVAAELLTFLDGAVLCAHNARFDHGFLKNEFRSMGINLRLKVLCTVKLSRRLYPQHRSHSLDALIDRYGLTCTARHRAMGDVETMAAFLDAAAAQLGWDRVAFAAQELLQAPPSLPGGIEAELVERLPETPGVYLFFGENSLPLYIGKSINIRQRVLAHFSGDHAAAKAMRISQEIRHIEWIETAGEFGALLLESRLIKERQPVYNRRLRRQNELYSWRIADTAEIRPAVALARGDDIRPEALGELFGVFRSRRQALEALRLIADRHRLCPQALGLESGTGPCFAYQLKRCDGVCAGKQSTTIHYLKFRQAMMAHRLKAWPYSGRIGIQEHNTLNDKSVIHIFEHWVHLATVDSGSDLEEMAYAKSEPVFDLDTYRLLVKELCRPDVKIIRFPQTQYNNTDSDRVNARAVSICRS
ncbi:MAG TPA: exonuclease domain-containing protein [Burkholderiales bacterium]|nr:exonuclease domain-containing protein [Burkholderiales bacterium]